MTTAVDVVTQSLEYLGIENELSLPDAYLQKKGFEQLIRMINRWAGISLTLGLILPTQPSDDLVEPNDTTDAIALSLAIEMQRISKVSASPSVKKSQKVAYQQIRASYGILPDQQYPSSLPIGSGYANYPRTRKYYPEPNKLGTNNNSNMGV